MRMLRNKSLLGIDAQVSATLLHRSWTVIAGGITVFMIPLFLDPVLQGYYFTFGNILALQVFFELGMSQVVVQFVAHEAAHLRKGADGKYKGDPESIGRLMVLRSQLRNWYLLIAIIFVGSIGGVGVLFFKDGVLDWIYWLPTWLCLVVLTGVNLNLSWRIAIIEGFAEIRKVARLRAQQSIVGFMLMWAGLSADLGLIIMVIIPTVSAVTTVLWLKLGPVDPFFAFNTKAKPNNPISWRKDIIPFQWRIALSWISGYFIFQLFTPLIFRQAGAAEAGRLGLAITVFNAISTLGMSWVNANAPNFAMLVARREEKALLQQFSFLALRSIVVTAAACAIFIIMVWVANELELQLVNRISSMPVLLCLSIVTVVNSAIFSAAIFMRAHREEPMLFQSLVCGLLLAMSSWYFSKYGALEMMLGYATVIVFIGLPWTIKLLNAYMARHTV